MSTLKDRAIAYLEGEIRALREELAERDETIVQLRSLIVPGVRTPREWKLTPAEERLFIALTQRDLLTMDGCLLAAQQHTDSSSPSLVAVRICHLRRKVEAFGAKIGNSFGVGYFLHDRRKWAEVLA